MQRVTNRLGLFRLGNGSSFTAASSRDTQRAFRDLQSALRSAETECKDSRSYFADCIFFFFFLEWWVVAVELCGAEDS